MSEIPGPAQHRPKFFGKYRGLVVENADPLQLGRILAQVPDVQSIVPLEWAMPSFPVAGMQMGAVMIPPIGAQVWVEFEKGDADYPIWTGCFFTAASEVPPPVMAGNPANPNIVIQSTGQNGLVISDTPGASGGVTLQSAGGASITVNDTGIYISNGKGAIIQMLGPSVIVNNGAWTV